MHHKTEVEDTDAEKHMDKVSEPRIQSERNVHRRLTCFVIKLDKPWIKVILECYTKHFCM